MIKLSDRLELMASKINRGESAADIGTDHGFLPLALWERGICSKVIMADVSRGSLNKALDNCTMLYPDESFDLRLGDGLTVLENGEVDNVIIAGMGGLLMIKIFEKDIEKTKSFNRFVLQPRISAGKLRYWLIHNGFSIAEDELVKEGKFICNVITAETGLFKNIKYIEENLDEIKSLDKDDIRLDIPLWLKKDKLFYDFAKRRYIQEKDVLKSLENASESWNGKKEKTLADIKYLEEVLI